MLTQAEAKRILDQVLMLARSTKGVVSARLQGTTAGNARFAVNEITSSGDVETQSLSVTVQYGKRAATATTNQLDERALGDVIARAQRMARLAPEDPETLAPLGVQRYATMRGASDQATIDHTPSARAKAIAAMISAGDRAKVQFAGFYEHDVSTLALASSEGLSATHTWTSAQLSCTARTTDGTGSGWAQGESHRVGDLDPAALAKIAIDKALGSAKPTKLEPGKYTVVLEPAAVAGLLGPMVGALDARRADEGRSFFAGKLGTKLFPDLVTVRSDPTDVVLRSAPFDGEGMPQRATTWIDKGTVKGLVYDRFWAQKQGKPATGRPQGWTLDGGPASRDELLRGITKGVLITRFWYIRSLDPQTLLLTGLTRDGTFLIENGKVTRPVTNFRFNESPVQMLAKCDLVGASVPVDRMRVPALRTHEFNLASVSEAV